MCGIAGYIDFNAAPREEVLRAMARSIHRRGPDAEGILVDGPCGLAHRRLSIIDLVGSPQPMQVTGSDISLSFNGEIYNYQDLRQILTSRGVDFRWAGDTEAMLRWIDAEWERSLPRFDGMFAFGAWNRRSRKLLLARDPLGKKPLFYATPAPGVLVFGSEIKALLEHPAVHAKLNHDSLRQVLRFRAVYGAGTLYAGVSQVEPGCWLEFSEAGIRTGRFYDLMQEAAASHNQTARLDDSALLERFGEMMEASVRKRLIADVPVGAFLSGGLDSSVIVALIRACRAPGAEIRTFSVGFSGDEQSELPHARAVADALRTTHTEVGLSEGDYAELFAEMTACRDAPLSEPADPAIARMSAIAKQSVKVVLSGEGSDEAFCGYPKYSMARAPWLLRASMRALGPTAVGSLAGIVGVDRRRTTVVARALSHSSELDRLVQWFSYLDRSTLSNLLPGLDWTPQQWTTTTASQSEALQAARAQPWAGPLESMQAVDCLTWLPGNLLERGDRMTMSAGLEMRVPFLDKALVPFGIGLPAHMKVRGRILKWIVRRWALGQLPQGVLTRRKWGFRVPLERWFRGHLRATLFDYLSASDGLCSTFGDREAVKRLLECHDSGRTDASMELWTLLSTEVWYQDVFLPRAGLVHAG